MTYLFTMTQRSDGMDAAECVWNGRTFTATSRNGASMALARVLCDAGAPEGPWEVEDSRTGQKRLYGRSLHGISRMTVKEGEKRPRFAEWQPHPMAEAAE